MTGRMSGGSFGAWRGASWINYNPDYLRVALRFDVVGSDRVNYGGFRLALSR